mmetsp:Transcript_79896/g.214701  ORF Transcript_79896/g.214701 Transcript_79896/m.214701 type:complete len:310 (-) Transcript_79896:728-1657(-)
MTPLSTHNRGGGHCISSPACSATSRSPARTFWLAATPPATTMAATSGSSSSAQDAARAARSQRCRTATVWKAAATSARCRRRSASGRLAARSAGSAFSTRVLTEVFRPEKEKSQPVCKMGSRVFESGTGKVCTSGSPSFASRSRCGPPGTCVIPSSRAVLSNASPMESSMVLPRIVCEPMPRLRTAMLWPPETSNVTKGNAGDSAFAGCSAAGCPAAAGGSRVTSVCASMWCTRTSGRSCAAAICRALRTPTSRHSPSPGPTVTATAESSAGATPARRSASSTVLSMALRCPSCARRGTTPPHCSWMLA